MTNLDNNTLLFEEWLNKITNNRGDKYDQDTIRSFRSRIVRLKKALGLDFIEQEWASDQCTHFLNSFEDIVDSNITIHGDKRHGLSSLKNAVVLYTRFLNEYNRKY